MAFILYTMFLTLCINAKHVYSFHHYLHLWWHCFSGGRKHTPREDLGEEVCSVPGQTPMTLILLLGFTAFTLCWCKCFLAVMKSAVSLLCQASFFLCQVLWNIMKPWVKCSPERAGSGKYVKPVWFRSLRQSSGTGACLFFQIKIESNFYIYI